VQPLTNVLYPNFGVALAKMDGEEVISYISQKLKERVYEDWIGLEYQFQFFSTSSM